MKNILPFLVALLGLVANSVSAHAAASSASVELDCTYGNGDANSRLHSPYFGRGQISHFKISYSDTAQPTIQTPGNDFAFNGRTEIDAKTGDYIFYFDGIYTPGGDYDYRDSMAFRYVIKSPGKSAANFNRSYRVRERLIWIPLHSWVAGKDFRYPLSCTHATSYQGVASQTGKPCTFSFASSGKPANSGEAPYLLNNRIPLQRDSYDSSTLFGQVVEDGQVVLYRVKLDEQDMRPVSQDRTVLRDLDQEIIDLREFTQCNVKGFASAR